MVRFNTRAFVVAFVVALACSPVHAQLISPFESGSVGLSPDEAARMKTAIRAVLQQYRIDARQDWQSADGKRAGTATITELFKNDKGQRCAMLQHKFTKGPGHPYYAPMCEVARDEWRIAF